MAWILRVLGLRPLSPSETLEKQKSQLEQEIKLCQKLRTIIENPSFARSERVSGDYVQVLTQDLLAVEKEREEQLVKIDSAIRRQITPSPSSSIEEDTIIFGEGYEYTTNLNDVPSSEEVREQFKKDCGRVDFHLETPDAAPVTLPANTEERTITEKEKNAFFDLVLAAAHQALGEKRANHAVYWSTQMLFGEVKQFMGTELREYPGNIVLYDANKDVSITIITSEGSVLIAGACYLKVVPPTDSLNPVASIRCNAMISITVDTINGSYVFTKE